MNIWLLNLPNHEKFIIEGRCQQKQGLFFSLYPPLTLANLAAILREKHEVKIIDSIPQNYNLRKLIRLYIKGMPDMVLINTSTPTIENDIRIIKKLHNIKKSEFYLFGVHATYFKKSLSKNKEFKVISGPPERFADELIGKKYKFSKLPVPAWDLVDLSMYKMPIKRKKFVLLKASQGCHYNCTFCTVPHYYGNKVEYRPVKDVIQELEYIKDLGINDVLFFSESFTLNKNFIRKLCKKIIEKKINISWVCNSRVDSVEGITLDLMKKAGCWLISFGIESSNQNILDKSNKKISLKKIREGVNLTYSRNILTLGHFVFGLPGETEKTIKNTIEFSKQLSLDFAMFYIATPYPGTQLYEFEKKNIKKKWLNFYYSSHVISSDINLKKWQKYAYIQFYLNKISLEWIRRMIYISRKSKISSN